MLGTGQHGQRPWGRDQLGTSKAQQGEEEQRHGLGPGPCVWKTLAIGRGRDGDNLPARTSRENYSARTGFSSSILSRQVISNCKNKASRVTPRLPDQWAHVPELCSLIYEIRVVTSRAAGKTANSPLAGRQGLSEHRVHCGGLWMLSGGHRPVPRGQCSKLERDAWPAFSHGKPQASSGAPPAPSAPIE